MLAWRQQGTDFLIDSFTVTLHNPNQPTDASNCAMGANCHIKVVEIPSVTWACNSMQLKNDSSETCITPIYLYIRQSYNRQHQPIGSHVPNPTDSPVATMLRLCSSLHIWWSRHGQRINHGRSPGCYHAMWATCAAGLPTATSDNALNNTTVNTLHWGLN